MKKIFKVTFPDGEEFEYTKFGSFCIIILWFIVGFLCGIIFMM